MIQGNMLNLQLSNSRRNKIKPAIKEWDWSNFKPFVKFD